MITKLQSISFTKNALLYCEKGGEVLTTNKCFGNANDIYNQMKEKETQNDRCTNKTFHIKIRAAPEDKGKLNNQDWIDIANRYALKIGFQDNMFAVYLHEKNTDKEHIHIVSTRIGDNNLAISNSYTHYKSQDFSRVIEKEYNLRKVGRKLEALKMNQEFIPNNKHTTDLKEAIFSAIDISDSIEDVVFILKNKNIQTKIGRGISFTDAKGVRKKGSEIDRKLSLRGIEKLLSYEQQEKRMNKKNRGFKM
ncbi:hypothetical protein [Polaribacter sp. HaHaR_3_91]|uniref:relaxase/mobilization nuclease domain-containing protein n=1 Tax=Polaribacter sp. HaHaR_3_91 TaxID=2745561 RepID=UPI001C4F4166|nr:hypothetical protein [Polaribacter sp. HaHaR_3_91]QXP64356.1 hypothetical protein H0I27_03990 [Polaribacter sp. HaHaR_3_91]